MNHINIHYYKTKIGEMILGAYENKLCLLDYRYRKMRTTIDRRIQQGLEADFVEQDDAILERTRSQLDEYLSKERTRFDIPLLMVGTEFQKKVWKALLRVPFGATSTYMQLAQEIGQKNAVRAVGSANGANAMSLVIPCHRIIGSNREPVGYAGGVSVKKRLLRLEQETLGMTDEDKYEFIGSKDSRYDHAFITAVKTTGIYCLPSCRARKPNRENVVFYDKKEDAVKDGFRACKLCKP